MITTTIATTSTISRLSLYYQQNYEYRARQENPEDGIRIATAQKPRTRTMLLVAFDSGGRGEGGGKRRELVVIARALRRLSPAGLQLPGYLSGKLTSSRRRREESPVFSRLTRSVAVSRVRTYRLSYWPGPGTRTKIQDFRPAREMPTSLCRETGRIHRRFFSFSL